MLCPYCNNEDTRVTDKRDTGSVTRRRRECLKCGKRFTTYEKIELCIYVSKKGGVREKFSRDKLLRGIEKCIQKRNFTEGQVENMVDDIEANVYRIAKGRDIASSRIGEIVMRKLKKIDKVAYIRFAAVYKHFDDISKFKEEVDSLQ